MKRRLLLALIVLATAVGWYFAGHVSQRQVNSMIASEVPPGSSATKVKAYLDSHGWRHSDLVETEVISDFDSYPGRKRVITAGLKGLRVGSVLSEGIFVNFLFDRNERLIDYKVREVFTF